MLNGYSAPPYPALPMHQALQRLGVPAAHSWQSSVVQSWKDGSDSLVLSGTGSGKSLCFQLPSLLCAKPVLVISPLISLMRDQCAAMNKRGINSCFLGSAQSDPNVEREALAGRHRLVYICPETALRLAPQLAALHRTVGVGLVAVDVSAPCTTPCSNTFTNGAVGRKLTVCPNGVTISDRNMVNCCCVSLTVFLPSCHSYHCCHCARFTAVTLVSP